MLFLSLADTAVHHWLFVLAPFEVSYEHVTLLQPKECEWHVTSRWKQMLVLCPLLHLLSEDPNSSCKDDPAFLSVLVPE